METVTIIYRSGTKVRVRVEGLTVTTQGGEVTKMEWKQMDPRPLALNCNEVESVWMGKR